MHLCIFPIILGPGKPRDVHYSFVYDSDLDAPYLRLRWKPPLYTGDSVFSYGIVHFTKEHKTPFLPFPFPVMRETLILDRSDDEFIHYEGVWTDSTRTIALGKNFTLYAINENGIGEFYTHRTHGMFPW